jgi:cell division protein FtsL
MAGSPRSEAGRAASGITAIDSSLPVALIIAAMIVGVAALVPLVQSSGATSVAGEIRLLQQERAAWQAQLRALEVEVARMGSLDRIEKEAAARFNMAPPQDVIYLTVDAPPPKMRRLPTRFLPPETEPTRAGSSLWEQAFGWIPWP